MQFTQYMRPYGAHRDVTIDRAAEVEAQALALVKAGCRFQIEVLMTGDVSMECVGPERTDDPQEGETLAHEIVANGPNVPPTVDRLVQTAHAKRFGAG